MDLDEAIGELQMSINSAVPAISTYMEVRKSGRFADQVGDEIVTVPVTTLDALIRATRHAAVHQDDFEGFGEKVVKWPLYTIWMHSIEYC